MKFNFKKALNNLFDPKIITLTSLLLFSVFFSVVWNNVNYGFQEAFSDLFQFEQSKLDYDINNIDTYLDDYDYELKYKLNKNNYAKL